MAAVDVAPAFTNNIDNLDIDFIKKQAQARAPFSPDGAELPSSSSSKDLTDAPAKTLKPLPVPSIASRKSRMEKKVEYETETRKASIRRLASRAFERQTGKQWTHNDDMSEKEWEIYNAEAKKSEEILNRKKIEEDAATTLANNIKYRENLLQEMNAELARKVEQYHMGQDDLAKITKDFETAIQQHIASTAPSTEGVKSSAARMLEEKQKKALKAQWRRSTSDDPVAQARQRQFAAAEDIVQLKARIEELRKELGRMMGQAQKAKSSSHRMREEQHKKDEMRRNGTMPSVDAPVKVYVKKAPEMRSHQQRMQAEQEKKAELRRKQRMSLDVSDIVGRPRSDTTSF